MDRRNWFLTAAAWLNALIFVRPVKPSGAFVFGGNTITGSIPEQFKPLWTHDHKNGDSGYVYDANGVDLGPVLRCNVETGLYEVRCYKLTERGTGRVVETTTMENATWRTYSVIDAGCITQKQAPAPLKVVPLRESIEYNQRLQQFTALCQSLPPGGSPWPSNWK